MKNIRTILTLVAVVGILIVVVLFLNAIMAAIVPIGITALVAFILGRMSVNFHVLSLLRRQPAAARTEQTAPAPEKSAAMPAVTSTIKEAPPKVALPEKDDDVKVEFKTEKDINADAVRLEMEIAKKNATYDPTAALEERRKRLLGDKKE